MRPGGGRTPLSERLPPWNLFLSDKDSAIVYRHGDTHWVAVILSEDSPSDLAPHLATYLDHTDSPEKLLES